MSRSNLNRVHPGLDPGSIKSFIKIPAFAGMVILVAIFLLPKISDAKTLQFEDKTWEINPNLIDTKRVSIRNDFDFEKTAKKTILGEQSGTTISIFDELTANIINDISLNINRQAKDAHLVIEDKIAKEFEPGLNGQGLDVYLLRNMLRNNDNTIILPVVISTPSKILSETNNLGIKELVALGESDFSGSPRNRIHNITVGAAKFNGLLIDPGQEFSFNEYLGDVDGEHGFLPELVIKKTGVVPEFGGGLCQVSSTAFRAAMNTGLPITARRNHSFAVQYYAPQGTDATIYPGVQDLKFVNNLNSPILIRTRIEGKKLFFEYYGTKDDRTITFEGPIQYDKKTNGAMKATWSREVTLNGETTKQTFNSVYQPPALFHPEEQAATPNPETTPTANNQPVTAGANITQ